MNGKLTQTDIPVIRFRKTDEYRKMRNIIKEKCKKKAIQKVTLQIFVTNFSPNLVIDKVNHNI